MCWSTINTMRTHHIHNMVQNSNECYYSDGAFFCGSVLNWQFNTCSCVYLLVAFCYDPISFVSFFRTSVLLIYCGAEQLNKPVTSFEMVWVRYVDAFFWCRARVNIRFFFYTCFSYILSEILIKQIAFGRVECDFIVTAFRNWGKKCSNKATTAKVK